MMNSMIRKATMRILKMIPKRESSRKYKIITAMINNKRIIKNLRNLLSQLLQGRRTQRNHSNLLQARRR